MAGIKSLAKDTAIYGLSSIIGRFLNWCLVPLYTFMFPAAEYGVVTYLYSFVALALIILTYGLETGFFRFANHEKAGNPLQVYTTSLISLATTSSAFFLLVWVLISPIANALSLADHHDYILIMALTVAIDAFTAIPFAFLRYQKRPMRFALIKLVNIGSNIGLNLFFILLCPVIHNNCPGSISWFYNADYGIGYIFLSNLISSVITLILLLPEITHSHFYFNGDLLKRMLRYSFPLLILGIAGIMNQTIDKILLPELISDPTEALTAVGIYGANYKIAIVMVMFIQAFRFAYEPFIFAQNKELSSDDKNKSYSDAMKFFIIFSFVIFIGVMYYLPILKFFISPSYFSGLKVVPIIMIAELCFGVFFNLSVWYKLTDQTQWGMYFSLLGLAITIALNILLVPHMGYMGCAYAALTCYFVMMVTSYFTGRKHFPIEYDIKSAARYTLIAAILYIAGITLPSLTEDSVAIFANQWSLLVFRSLLFITFLVYIIRKERIPMPRRHR